MKIDIRTESIGQYIAEVIHQKHGKIYETEPCPSRKRALESAQAWVHWFENVPHGIVESIYYILAVPETWPGPPPGADRYSGLHVKIGVAKDVRRRVQNLQTGTSGKLIIHALEPGSFDVEKLRHKQFKSDRRQGEWFACSPTLTKHIFSIWSRYNALPPDHQSEVMVLQDRIDILKGVRNVFSGPPDMINPSLHERWYGNIFVDLVYANRRK